LADSTFHAKFYLFSGDRLAICIYGSHNMTVGGTETNLESGTQLEISRPGEETLFQEALGCWTSLLPENCSMTRAVDRGLIDELLRSGLLFDEGAARDATALGEGKGAAEILPKIFPRARPKPPTPIPREAFVKITRSKRRVAVRGTRPRSRVEKAPPAQALVMQIVPHHNGEVFLSKNAINENPGFFGFPFSGKTVPKKSSNPSYPQRVPDPLVNVSVFGRGDKPLITRRSFNLNMVYYEKKSEIRITLSPDLAGKILPFAAMVMRLRVTPYDYDIEVFNPDSTSYDQFVSACNQTLPSGRAARPRKYGWL